MSRPIDADALIPDFLAPSYTNREPCKKYVSMEQIHNAPTIEPEITQEDIELYCRRRCLTVITDDLYNEMKMRWSAQPTQSNAPNTLDAISRQDAVSRISDLLMVELRGERLPTWDEVYNAIKELPSAQPYRKVGKWIDHSDDGYVECPFCGSATNCDDNINELHYCFSCGAKMEKQE